MPSLTAISYIIVAHAHRARVTQRRRRWSSRNSRSVTYLTTYGTLYLNMYVSHHRLAAIYGPLHTSVLHIILSTRVSRVIRQTFLSTWRSIPQHICLTSPCPRMFHVSCAERTASHDRICRPCKRTLHPWVSTPPCWSGLVNI